MAEVTCRFIEHVGWRARIIALWDNCPKGYSHSGRVVVDEIMDPKANPKAEGGLDKYADHPGWDTMTCDKCGEAPPNPEEVKRAFGWKRFFPTETGKPEIGDMFWLPCRSMLYGGKCFNWDNCEGKHLHVLLPDGHEWDVDGRAKNCTMKDDRSHRCWVREGDPPNVTAGKTGHTCSAGAGSIATGKWHGFLRGGKLIG